MAELDLDWQDLTVCCFYQEDSFLFQEDPVYLERLLCLLKYEELLKESLPFLDLFVFILNHPPLHPILIAPVLRLNKNNTFEVFLSERCIYFRRRCIG